MKQAFLVALGGIVLGACFALGAAQAADGATETPNRVAITVSDNAYAPDRVAAHKDKELTLVFTRTSEGTCGAIVKVPAFGIKKDLPLDTPVEISITPKESGDIVFMCGMKMMKGQIIVTQ